jgi:uncharacterized protein YdeI (YjbR/CyaY-like superfamily)
VTEAQLAGENLPRIEMEGRPALRRWLEENHQQTSSVWLVTYKKNDPLRYLAYGDIVDELLCFGWVDSLPRKLDETRSMLLISPRKTTSNWSKVNRDKVERLTAAGLMTAAGVRQVEEAKADGRWTALDQAEPDKVPADLVEAFGKFPGAGEKFHAFPNSVKRGILEWLMNAKRPETRAKRVEETARLAADNIRANQWRQ